MSGFRDVVKEEENAHRVAFELSDDGAVRVREDAEAPSDSIAGANQYPQKPLVVTVTVCDALAEDALAVLSRPRRSSLMVIWIVPPLVDAPESREQVVSALAVVLGVFIVRVSPSTSKVYRN